MNKFIWLAILLLAICSTAQAERYEVHGATVTHKNGQEVEYGTPWFVVSFPTGTALLDVVQIGDTDLNTVFIGINTALHPQARISIILSDGSRVRATSIEVTDVKLERAYPLAEKCLSCQSQVGEFFSMHIKTDGAEGYFSHGDHTGPVSDGYCAAKATGPLVAYKRDSVARSMGGDVDNWPVNGVGTTYTCPENSWLVYEVYTGRVVWDLN